MPAERVRRRGTLRRAGLTALVGLALTGCAQDTAAPDPTAATAQCAATDASRVVPTTGALLGVNLDWGAATVAQYSERLGRSPAVAVGFVGFPLTDTDLQNLHGAAEQLRPSGGVLLLTLEPAGGLATVTPRSAAHLATELAEVNSTGVPVIVRFAHEMNGSWYPWSQQPERYVAAFRTVADAVHAEAPGSAMMWAPNYGGGYPFAGGRFQADPADPQFRLLDTDADGATTAADDPYSPYYPGDDAVDWVGMSLYHWGSAHPWGENEIPEDGKLESQLAGTYDGLDGDHTAVPDFYKDYAIGRDKPLAIPETAAFFVGDGGGEAELAIKRAWWRQALSDRTLKRFPMLRMVNWFEWDKHEAEVGGAVDWTVTSDRGVRKAFLDDLPDAMLSAEALPDWCATGAG